MAVFGVLKPRPTSLYHLRPPFPTLLLLLLDFAFAKTCGCFWNARSLWTVNSVAMIAVVGNRLSRGRLARVLLQRASSVEKSKV